MKVVVIGATGLIGSKVVEKLRAQGHEVVAASPESGVDTLTGEGLGEVVRDADVVVDVTNAPSFADDEVLEFFTTSTRNLLDAEHAARVGHHVALSVVGTDRLAESGYFRGKIAQERLIRSGPVPYTIVHATQFFEFIERIAQAAADGDTVRVAPVLIQPMAADDVAAAVAMAAVGEAVNRVVEVAGPEQFRLDDLVRQALGARNDPRQVVADATAPYFGAQLDERTLVPDDGARLGSISFRDWIRQSLAATR